jgi:exosortase E/protease (VPEID-CTERM system)
MTIHSVSSVTARPRGINLGMRALFAALVLAANKNLLNFFVDFDAAQTARGVGNLAKIVQHDGLRFAVTLAAILALFAYLQGNERLRTATAAARGLKVRVGWLLVHIALFAPLAVLCFSFYGNHGLQLPTAALALLVLLVAAASVAALLHALAPWALWREAASALGVLWLYAGAAAALATGAIQWSQSLWAPTSKLTFELVSYLLRPFIPTLTTDPITQVLDTGRFAVQVSDLCSGLEGMGLLLAFCCAWLLYFRKEYRWPRALVIIPAGLGLLFVLNVLRIAALVAIGNAGFADIAIYGFHSQAGWIAFNAAASGIAFFSRRIRWLTRGDISTAGAQFAGNPTAAYLLPFLSILATGMLTQAVSGGFETWYPLRFCAAAATLWIFRGTFKTLDFRFTWRGVAAGIAATALWLAAAHLVLLPSAMPAALAGMSQPSRTLWIATRALAAVITVPIAEELAYRGFLMRRIRAADFESVRFGDCGISGLLVSATVFGLGHGSMWVPGVLVGLIYGWIAIRTGRIGESIAAHAVTNALICVYVLSDQQWQLW